METEVNQPAKALKAKFVIVDSSVTPNAIEEVMKNDRFAIQNSKTGKIIVGMRWRSGQGIRYRPCMLVNGKLLFAPPKNSTFVAGVGLTLYEDVINNDFVETRVPVSPMEQSALMKAALDSDFGTGEEIVPDLLTEIT